MKEMLEKNPERLFLSVYTNFRIMSLFKIMAMCMNTKFVNSHPPENTTLERLTIHAYSFTLTFHAEFARSLSALSLHAECPHWLSTLTPHVVSLPALPAAASPPAPAPPSCFIATQGWHAEHSSWHFQFEETLG